MTYAYSTRRASAQQDSTLPIPIRVSASPSASSPLSSSAGKSRRTSASAATSRRRLSSSASNTLRPGVSVSPATGSLHASSLGTKGPRSAGVTPSTEDDAEDGEVKGAALAKANKGQLYGCEVCGKVYRHSTCLVKHRWEHTAHWKEASKLLLSKHQQVQLLEAAAILQVASAGSSLPEEKSYWPAAVSPPSSGLLGSHSLNISVLSSPRLNSSLALPALSHSLSNSERDLSPPDESLGDVGEEDDEELESVSTGDDLLAEEMFDMDLDSEPVTVNGRAGSVGEDSGYGSLGAMGSSSSAPHQGPRLGFFDAGRHSSAAIV